MGLVGNGWANCFRTHNELTMGLSGKYPLAPSVYTAHLDNSVRMSGDGESEEGIAVEPLIKFVSIPANSLRAPHKSAKCRVRLTAVDTAASVITTIMPADGVDTSPNVINIAGKRHRS